VLLYDAKEAYAMVIAVSLYDQSLLGLFGGVGATSLVVRQGRMHYSHRREYYLPELFS